MTVPNLLAAVCGITPDHPEKITLIFDIPVASSGYTVGLSARANGVPLTISSAVQGSDTHQVVITLSGGPAFNAILDVSFDQTTGDWHNSSDDVPSFTHTAVTNASHVGDPDSTYPLSSVITEKLVAKNGAINATLGVDLNRVDAALVMSYEAQVVDFGGTFGITGDNPSGVVILQDRRSIQDGMMVSKIFFVTGHPDWAAIAAAEWETSAKGKVANALAALRTIDAGVTFGNRVIWQV